MFVCNNKKSKEPTVLIVTPFFRPNVGGVETRFDEITKSLAKNGVKSCVLTFQPLITKGVRGKRLESHKNILVYRKEWIGMNLFHKLLSYPFLEFLYLVIPVFWNTFWFLLFNKRRLNITTIHAAGLNATLALVLLRPFFKYRLVSSTHALYDFKKGSAVQRVISWTLDKVDLIFAIGEVSREELISIGIDKEKITVMPTWVNQKVFRPLNINKCKKELGLSDEFVVGFVGRLNKNKGVQIVIELANKFEGTKNVTFIIIGTGELDEVVKREVKNLSNTRYLGKIKNYDLPRYINAFDVFLAPSQYSEGFARASVEALSCGVPVLASNKGHLPEIVIGGVGWLVAANFKSFYKKLKEIIEDKNSLGKMKKYCAKTSKERFSEQGILKIIEAYKI